jgi:hypothetical protein
MKTFTQFLFEQKNQDIVVYPGRFQPMFNHHKMVYDNLVSQFGKNNVYISTSNDTSNKLNSPLNFEQKKRIMIDLFNIPESKILQAASPYNLELYNNIRSDKSRLFFALGEKDGERLCRNIKNGINYKADNITPAVIQPESALMDLTISTNSQFAFTKIIQNIESEGGVMSATDFRTAIRNAENIDQAKIIFFRAYGQPVDDSMDDIIFAIRSV